MLFVLCSIYWSTVPLSQSPFWIVNHVLTTPLGVGSYCVSIQKLLGELTPEQVEIAAQTSYAYWLATLSERPPTPAEREKMALREIRRALFKNPYKKALAMVKSTVAQRQVSVHHEPSRRPVTTCQ